MPHKRIIDNLADLEEFIRKETPTVLLDTNILIKGCGKSEERKLVADLCAILDVCICDTVYWEFLRNTSIDSFREKRQFLAQWPGAAFLKEDKILRENADVKEMHTKLFLLLLWICSKDIKRVIKAITPDLWIAATAVQHRIDYILTTNSADFSDDLFTTIATISSRDDKYHLLAFEREKVRNIWRILKTDPVFTINSRNFFTNEKN